MTHATHQILVIEDEPASRSVLRVLLGSHGYRLIEAETAMRGEIEARSHKPDLLLVDLGLPDGSRLVVVRNVRFWSPVPIIVLSARAREEQKVLPLDAGANDYITKPFSAPKLLSRVRAVLGGGARTGQTPILQFGAIRIDLHARTSQGPRGDMRGRSSTTSTISTRRATSSRGAPTSSTTPRDSAPVSRPAMPSSIWATPTGWVTRSRCGPSYATNTHSTRAPMTTQPRLQAVAGSIS
jgi:CheY-like chemotaxis protein